MKKTAHYLASQGRYGDTELLHVTKGELAALRGLGSLTGAKVTINPKTGLPEAFNFKSLIPAIVGIGATVASGGTLSPLMAGLISGATTTAVTGDIKQGLASGITGGMMSGLGSGLAEMGGAGMAGAEAAGTAAASEAAAGGLGSGMAGMGTDQLVQQSVADQMAQQAGAGFGAGADMMSAGSAGLGIPGTADPTAMSAGIGSLPSSGAPYATAPTVPGMENLPAAADYGQGAIAANVPAPASFSGDTFMQNAQSGDAWESAFGGDNLKKRVMPGLMGLSSVAQNAYAMSPEDIEEENERAKAKNAPSANARQEKFSSRKYAGGPSDPYYAQTGSGEPTMFYAAGGGVASLPTKDSGQVKLIRAIRGRYRSRKAAMEDMQVRGSFMDKLGIRNPDDPILDYAFGYTAQQGKKKQTDRMARTRMTGPGGVAFAGGGEIAGPGDGMSDSISANIDGEQQAALSTGEHVVPADAVSHLGNGSTEAGHKALYDMIARVRQARTGSAEQAPAIDPAQVMPV